MSNSLWVSNALLLSEFINVVSILFYGFIEFIILLYTFSVISFVWYREYIIFLIWFSKFSDLLLVFNCVIVIGNWMNVLVMWHTRFRVNPHSIVAWISRNSLLEARAKSESLSDCNWTRTQNHLVRKRTLNHLAKLCS